jgi:hypothetical protein
LISLTAILPVSGLSKGRERLLLSVAEIFLNRNSELGTATAFNNSLSWLTLFVEFSMPDRAIVGRVEYRVFEKGVTHRCLLFTTTVEKKKPKSIGCSAGTPGASTDADTHQIICAKLQNRLR